MKNDISRPDSSCSSGSSFRLIFVRVRQNYIIKLLRVLNKITAPNIVLIKNMFGYGIRRAIVP
jgi:hypothetical protein